MKVSIICPLFKGARYISKITDMVKKNYEYCKEKEQDVSVELIFVNDYPEECVEIEQNLNINIVLCENDVNRGIHYSRVQGYNVSSGEYILFLDQDDEIVDEYIFSQIINIGNSDAVLCNGYNKGQDIYISKFYIENACKKDFFLKGYNLIISPGQVLLKRNAIVPYWTKYILTNNGADDYFLWILMFLTEKRFNYNYNKLYKHVTTGINTSNDTEKMTKSVLEMVDFLFQNTLITEDIKNAIESRFIITETKDELKKRYNRNRRIVEILDIWLSKKENNKTCKAFFMEQCIDKVIVYGYGILGRHLVEELCKIGIEIECIIDKKNIIDNKFKYKKIGDEIDTKSVIIITPVIDVEEIQNSLQNLYGNRIIHISQVIENMQ